MRLLTDGFSARARRKFDISLGDALVIATLRQLLADALLGLVAKHGRTAISLTASDCFRALQSLTGQARTAAISLKRSFTDAASGPKGFTGAVAV